MAIIFGNINNGTGAGSNLWKLNGAAPNTIALNDLAGVTGIRAGFPANADLELAFREVAPGILTGGFSIYETPTKIMFLGAQISGTDKSAMMAAQDTATGIVALKYANFDSLGRPIVGSFLNDMAGNTVEEFLEFGQYVLRFDNATTLDKTEVQQTQNAREINIYKAGVEVFRLRIDENGLAVYNNAGANLLFQISDTGELLTNQTQAATATDTTIVGRLPVYDENGILIGYAPLMIDP